MPSLAMNQLMSGTMIPAILSQLDSSLGWFWYAAVFFTEWFALYLRTESIMLPTLVMLWTAALFGTLMPGLIIAKFVSASVMLGLAVIVLWALSPFLRR